MNWYITALKKQAVFSGRARRREFWTFILVNLVIRAVLELLIRIDVISLIFYLVVLLPETAVTIRRLHDTGRNMSYLFLPLFSSVLLTTLSADVIYGMVSGFLIPEEVPPVIVVGGFILLALIPIIALLVFLLQDSQVGENEYGPNPKEEPYSNA